MSCFFVDFWMSLLGTEIPAPWYTAQFSAQTYLLLVWQNWESGWWFGTFFIFPYIGNNHPNWRSYCSEGFKPPTSFLLFWQNWTLNIDNAWTCHSYSWFDLLDLSRRMVMLIDFPKHSYVKLAVGAIKKVCLPNIGETYQDLQCGPPYL